MSTKSYYDLSPEERDELADEEDALNGDDDYEEDDNDDED